MGQRLRGALRFAVLIVVVAVGATFLNCSNSLAPDGRSYYSFSNLDSYASPGRIDLQWFTTTTPPSDPGQIGLGPEPGPPIAWVAVLRSTKGPGGPYEEVIRHRSSGRDSASVAAADGQTEWFRVQAYTLLGTPILASRIVATQSGPVTNLAATVPMNPAGRWGWSPNSDSLIYVEDLYFGVGEVRVVDAATLSVGLLGGGGPATGFFHDAEWSPDGRRVAYTSTPSTTFANIDYRVRLFDRDDPSQAWTTPGRVDFGGVWAGNDRLYFCRGTYEPPNIYQIWRVDRAPGAIPVAITSGPDRKTNPSVRIGDELIVLEVEDHDSGRRHIATCTPSTGQMTALTNDDWCNDSSPSWGVPDSRVIFTSDRSGHQEIWSIDLSTGAMNLVTRSIRDHRKASARLSPDGQKLAMVDHDGSWRGALGIVVSPLP